MSSLSILPFILAIAIRLTYTIDYLLTECEVFTMKYQTEALLYWPSDSEASQYSKAERSRLMVEVVYYMALFITKINTTGTNFSHRYLRLLQLCQNADHGV